MKKKYKKTHHFVIQNRNEKIIAKKIKETTKKVN